MPDYISVRNWRRFQHYDPAKRTPPWIKIYTELLHDHAYLALSTHRRGVLQGLWLEYASSRCRVAVDTASLSRRLNARVTMADLVSLSQAGFIDIVASAALADGYHVATPEVEVEKETPKPPFRKTPNGPPVCPDCGVTVKGPKSLAEHRYHSHNGPEPDHWLEAERKATT